MGEAVLDGETGLLVEPGQPEALAAALLSLLADGDRRSRMGIAARQRAQSEFSVGTMARRYESVYGSVGHFGSRRGA